MTCKENSAGTGNRSSDTGRHNQCSASVPTCGTMRFRWDRADLVCDCPHSRAAGCGHKFGSVNPPPCGFHATAIAVARAQRNRRAPLLEVMEGCWMRCFLIRKSTSSTLSSRLRQGLDHRTRRPSHRGGVRPPSSASEPMADSVVRRGISYLPHMQPAAQHTKLPRR